MREGSGTAGCCGDLRVAVTMPRYATESSTGVQDVTGFGRDVEEAR